MAEDAPKRLYPRLTPQEFHEMAQQVKEIQANHAADSAPKDAVQGDPDELFPESA